MNKKHWITVCLDGRISLEEICAGWRKLYFGKITQRPHVDSMKDGNPFWRKAHCSFRCFWYHKIRERQAEAAMEIFFGGDRETLEKKFLPWRRSAWRTRRGKP